MRGGNLAIPLLLIASLLAPLPPITTPAHASVPLVVHASVPAPGVPSYVDRGPILITGDADLLAPNGVTGGSGTPSDPYVISGWRINTTGTAIDVRNTRASLRIEDVQVHNEACTAPGPACGDGISVTNASNVEVRRANVSGVANGIGLAGVIGGRVTNSTVASLFTGISAGLLVDGPREWRSLNITLVDNVVFGRGMYTYGMGVSANNSIMSRNVVGGAYQPYVVAACRNVTVSRNLAVGGGYSGMYVHSGSDVLVESNDFVGIASGAFALLEYGSSAVRTVGNLFQGSGTLTVDLQGSDSSATYHNAFEASEIVGSDPGLNSWDDGYPSGGNYWSDYAGIDLCSGANQSICTGPDGIGDTPRNVSLGSSDRYPLMQPYGVPSFAPLALFATSAAAVNTTTPVFVDASASADSQDPSSALEVRWDWESDGVWDTAWSTVKTADHLYSNPGSYRIRMSVRDTSGLESQTSRTVIADNLAPVATATPSGLAGTGGWYRSNVTVAFQATDDLAGVASIRYRLDGGPWSSRDVTPLSRPPFYLKVGEGVHVVEYFATDAAGNTAPVRVLNISADTTPPELSSPAPISPLSVSRVTVAWTGTDSLSGIAGYQISVDGGPYVDVGRVTQTNLTLADGAHSVVVRAVDAAGNPATAQTTLVIDTAPSAVPGPYDWMVPIGLALVVGIAAVLAAFLLLRRRRRRASPPGNP